nr:meiosis expressed gene 1 protein homolog isoform X1 [Peromyscus maniculatus bairdii]
MAFELQHLKSLSSGQAVWLRHLKHRTSQDSLEIIARKASVAMASSDVKPKSISRAKKWSEEIENLYRFQQAGYRDEIEYKQVNQVAMVDRWPETGYVKKLQRRDNTFYYYNKQRECEDKEVHKVKIYAY